MDFLNYMYSYDKNFCQVTDYEVRPGETADSDSEEEFDKTDLTHVKGRID